MELDLSSFEVITATGSSASNVKKSDEVVKFSEVDMTNDVLIGEEEIPF